MSFFSRTRTSLVGKRKIKRFCRIIMTKQEKAEGERMRKVYRLIRQLGMTKKYKGYYYVAEAVMMSMELQDYPIKITKDIYAHMAKQFKSTPVNIEHDIRTVINVCWTANKETMDRIAGYPLRYRPTNSEFVDMLAYYLLQTEYEEEEEQNPLMGNPQFKACQNLSGGL